MRKILLLLSGMLITTSCATILDNKSYVMNVDSNLKPSQVQIKKQIYTLPAQIEVTRSFKDLNMTFVSDSVQIDYVLKSKLSNRFKYLNLVGGVFAPFNYTFDMMSEKRYHYGKDIYLNTRDTVRIINNDLNNIKNQKTQHNIGDTYVRFSIPYANSINLVPDYEGRKSGFGFFGFSIGVDYYHRTNQFLNASYSHVIDFPLPLPAPVHYEGENENVNSKYFSLSNNHVLGRFTIGYGLAYSINNWELSNSEIENLQGREPIAQKSKAIGLVMPASYRINHKFSLGLVYQPSFYRLDGEEKWAYEHVISVEFIYKLQMIKGNKQKAKSSL